MCIRDRVSTQSTWGKICSKISNSSEIRVIQSEQNLYSNHLSFYQHEILKIRFLEKCQNKIQHNPKLSQLNNLCIYFLQKVIIFQLQNMMSYIKPPKNVFNLDNWNNFSQSISFQQIQQEVEAEIMFGSHLLKQCLSLIHI
eukprot:TRINITY_DN3977_c0_g1_i1.p1 TRINITY_DN3977_c0_g1~~TRINITY_DN3977_c0_g1_i1.p1  ORF type:complete len:141 (+),score=18.42 TRINITY_DN3977_c0_g1_i1:178-600(+)